MRKYLSAAEVAQRLDINVKDVGKLVAQGILHPERQQGGAYFFDLAAIERIVQNRRPTLSDQAAQLDTQMHQEMLFSVSTLQRLRRRLSIATLITVSIIAMAIIATAFLFVSYPERLSSFFGYYYQFNHVDDSPVLPGGGGEASVNASEEAAVKTSVLADVLRPIAATSLVMVKAVNAQQYAQIVTPPAQGAPGPAGSQGPAGTPGTNGLPGPAGLNGTPGAKGANGTDGLDGTSVADVTTTPGDLIYRDAADVAARLGVGTTDQVLTVVNGLPEWTAAQTTPQTDTLASVTARGAVTATALTLSSTANDLTAGTLRLSGAVITNLTGSGLTVTNGDLGVAGLTNASLSGAAGISNANLAHSSLTFGSDSGSLVVTLGGTLNIRGAGITQVTAAGSTLTVTTSEEDTLASVTARGASTNSTLTLNGDLNAAGSVNLTAIASCRQLVTDAAGTVQCAAVTPAAASFTDTAPAAFGDNDTTELFTAATRPNITPDNAAQAVLVSVHARFTNGGSSFTDVAVRIVRNVGSAASCSTSNQVGDSFSALLTQADDMQDATASFLDFPASTAQVFYTICTSSDSIVKKQLPVVNRIDVELVKVGLN